MDPKDASASKNNKCILPYDYGDLKWGSGVSFTEKLMVNLTHVYPKQNLRPYFSSSKGWHNRQILHIFNDFYVVLYSCALS